MFWLVTFLELFLFLLQNQGVLGDDPVVDTNHGRIQGFQAQATQDPFVQFFAFEGIPYAQPPIGGLRFKAPVPHDPWPDTLMCQRGGQMCSQKTGGDSIGGGEDCLFLNVYSRDLNPERRAPVMVFVHGGSYVNGQGIGNSPNYLMDKDVVYVNLNYRMDVLGFLSTLDENAYGNAGLKDVLLALQWVQENIQNFGGDPGRVTLFGESAGSNAISLIHLSPRSQGLIHRVISESSSALSTRHLQLDPLRYATNLAAHFGVDTSSTWSIVEGLRNVGLRELILAANDPGITGFNGDFGPFPFYPVIEPPTEEAVISDTPYNILEQGLFNRVPFIFGHNSNEGTVGYDMFQGSGMSVGDFDTKFELWASKAFRNAENAVIIGQVVRENYMGTDSVTNVDRFQRYLAAELYVRANRKEVDFLRQYSEGYYYVFSYKGTHTTGFQGVGHGEELQYIFNYNGDGSDLSGQDIVTRQRMVLMWTNFAATGNPTPDAGDPLLQGIQWPILNSASDFKALQIDNNLFEVFEPDQEEYLFWEQLFYLYGVSPLVTY